MDVFLGIDYGRARIGVAKSDALGVAAHPVTTVHVRSTPDVVGRIAALAKETGASRVVVGRPVFLGGKPSAMTREVESFMKALAERTGLEVVAVDERLTSQEASRRLAEQGRSARQARSVQDVAAAVILLQAYLDRERASCTKSPNSTTD